LHIAVVGAQGTGKTALVAALRTTTPLAASPHAVEVEEALPLMQAVSHALQRHDASLIPRALLQHRRYVLTLLLGMDLATTANASPFPQAAACDALLRQTLQTHGIAYAVVYGIGAARTACALQAIEHHTARLGSTTQQSDGQGSWQWCCDTCSDAACEHLLFSRLVKQ
jgi:HTH-type transcriptional regulator, transcriptional repressor of NAD biosynthesis genes